MQKKRVRIRRQPAAKTATSIANDIATRLDVIASDITECNKLAFKIAAEKEELFELMKDKHVPKWATDKAEAEIVSPPTRDTTHIGIKDFFKAVDKNMDILMAAATITITNAKKHLSGKEIDSISTKKTSTQKQDVLNITLPKA